MDFLDLILPRQCAGCRSPNTRWCSRCAHSTTLRTVERSTLTTPVYALSPYAGPARKLVLAYKDQRRELAPILGRTFAAALIRLAEERPPWADDIWLIPAPSRSSAARRRGGNHMLRAATHTARALARQGIPSHVAPALAMAPRTRDSVGLTAGQRATNLYGALTVTHRNAPPPGTPAVLIDDVVTTGATAAECVRALDKADIPVAAILAFTATA